MSFELKIVFLVNIDLYFEMGWFVMNMRDFVDYENVFEICFSFSGVGFVRVLLV